MRSFIGLNFQTRLRLPRSLLHRAMRSEIVFASASSTILHLSINITVLEFEPECLGNRRGFELAFQRHSG